MTDSKFLFDDLTKTTTITKKRLMIDWQTMKEAYDSFEDNDIVFIRLEFDIDDELTRWRQILVAGYN